jgi:protein O-GlcNAc transferase
LRLWSRVLQAAPDSRLLLLAISESHRNRIRKIFWEAGVNERRIEFTGRRTRAEYFNLYNQIDVCLDPLPYNGITTTLDALWMGTSVVTLAGHTAPGRAGLSILSTVGMPEFVAHSPEKFIEIAVRGGTATREEIRKRFRESPLMDAKVFAKNVEHAYREMWHRFVL